MDICQGSGWILEAEEPWQGEGAFCLGLLPTSWHGGPRTQHQGLYLLICIAGTGTSHCCPIHGFGYPGRGEMANIGLTHPLCLSPIKIPMLPVGSGLSMVSDKGLTQDGQ